jgi:hypothetical protein
MAVKKQVRGPFHEIVFQQIVRRARRGDSASTTNQRKSKLHRLNCSRPARQPASTSPTSALPTIRQRGRVRP